MLSTTQYIIPPPLGGGIWQKRELINLKFYNVKTRQMVDIDDKDVEVVTMKNGKKAAKAMLNGVGMFKILSKEDAARLSK